MNDYITIETKTWDINRENLFDYESKSLKKNLLTSNNSQIKIYGSLQGNCNISQHPLDSSKEKPLFNIYKDNSNFRVKASEQDLWFVIAYNQKNKREEDYYELKKGDILKLGRKELEIFSFKFTDSCYPSVISNNSCVAEDKICRICYDCKSNKLNPLLSLCDCQGSLKYTHLYCIKEWMKNKVKIIDDWSTSYIKFDLSGFKCEICSSFMKFSHEENGFHYHLLDILEDYKNYLIIKQENTNFLIFNMTDKKELLIGRGINVNFKLDDSTVSRVHCKILVKNDQLYIEDCDSKFGTLVKLRKSFIIEGMGKNYTLQKNNNLIAIRRSEKRRKMLDFCFCGCN